MLIGALVVDARCPSRTTGSLTLARYAYPLPFSALLYSSVDRYVLVFRGHYLDAGMNTWELTRVRQAPERGHRTGSCRRR